MKSDSNQQEKSRSSTNPKGSSSTFKKDFLASIVVFLVALPLCMGIAIASGVPVAAGLITGIVGGLIVGSIAGAPLQVSGPAAGLTVIVFELVEKHGLEVLGIAVLIAGVLQLTAGLLRYGRWFRAVSPAVIHGMLAGIGILILSSQFHVMVDDAPKGSGIKNLVSIPEAIVKGLPIPEMGSKAERTARRDLLQEVGALHEQQVQIREFAALQIPLAGEEGTPEEYNEDLLDRADFEPLVEKQQLLSEQLASLTERMESEKIAGSVQDPVGLNKATALALEQSKVALDDLRTGAVENIRSSQADAQYGFEEVLRQLKNHDWAAKVGILTILVLVFWKTLAPKRLSLIPAPLVAVSVATAAAVILKLPILYVEVPDNLWSEVHYPSLTVLQSVSWGVVIQAGLVLAVVASAETLLCATAVDQMQSETRTNYNRELAAQGIGNMVCGFLGALPMTGVIVRSSANIEAGGKTRLSTILHGCWLLVFVSFLAFLLRMIPTAALAAMLVYIGYKLVNFQSIKDLKKYGWGEVAIYFVTVGTIVGTDLLTGVLTGIGLSALKLLYVFSHLKVALDVDEEEKKATMQLEGSATFVRLPVLAESLDRVPGNVELHVDLKYLQYIDHACLDLLMNWEKQHEVTGGTLIIDWDSLHAKFASESGNQADKRVA